MNTMEVGIFLLFYNREKNGTKERNPIRCLVNCNQCDKKIDLEDYLQKQGIREMMSFRKSNIFLITKKRLVTALFSKTRENIFCLWKIRICLLKIRKSTLL